ncbi:unnamed protein product, partial [Phaeothamnion confervicola]
QRKQPAAPVSNSGPLGHQQGRRAAGDCRHRQRGDELSTDGLSDVSDAADTDANDAVGSALVGPSARTPPASDFSVCYFPLSSAIRVLLFAVHCQSKRSTCPNWTVLTASM